MPLILGFRDSLWWVAKSSPARAGRDGGLLLAVAAAVTFRLTLAAETLARAHQGT